MKNLNIREAEPDDIQALVNIYNHYVLETHVTFDLDPVDVDAAFPGSINTTITSGTAYSSGISNGEVIGYASSSKFRVDTFDQSVETTIYLSPRAQRNGFGAQLYEHLLRSLDAANVHRCYGIIALPNDASVALRAFRFL
ncbi:MAG: GNAT family N-acetyltransferase [Candidatus Azotimanducaceae bacterium WSBS_2022_MAG_OTU7]